MFKCKERKLGKNLMISWWYGTLLMNIYGVRPDEMHELEKIKATGLALAKKKLKNFLPTAIK